MHDPHHLARFVQAQDPIYPRVLDELRHGHKRTHWMWFVFPQLAGLGHSETARRFAIASDAEARAYLAHPTLGPRLRECTQVVLDLADRTAEQIFGWPDVMKLRSSLTLFAHVASATSSSHAAPEDAVFRAALEKYFAGEPDDATLGLLARGQPGG